jgi:hypothetical protein
MHSTTPGCSSLACRANLCACRCTVLGSNLPYNSSNTSILAVCAFRIQQLFRHKQTERFELRPAWQPPPVLCAGNAAANCLTSFVQSPPSRVVFRRSKEPELDSFRAYEHRKALPKGHPAKKIKPKLIMDKMEALVDVRKLRVNQALARRFCVFLNSCNVFTQTKNTSTPSCMFDLA